MSQKLETAKEIIKQNIDSGRLGIYDTRNDSDDNMFSLYEKDGLKIYICYNYEYFEVIGLLDEEFKELMEYYESLLRKMIDDEVAEHLQMLKKNCKIKIIEQLGKLGYMYSTKLWDDGTVMTYMFRRPDCMRDGCFWEVAIEDHTEDDGEDWLIFVRYHDPDEKDWFGNQRDISGCVEFETMKLIVEFTEILKKEKTNVK